MTTFNASALSTAVNIEVAQTVDSKRIKVGELDIFAPSLRAFGIDIDPVGVEDDGSLKYAELPVQWLYGAVLAAVKSNARNKLQKGSVELKPGNKIATTLEELITPAESGSAVLAERRTLIELFKGYLAGLDKAENVKRLLLTFLEKPETLALQPAEQRAKIQVYFLEFGDKVEDKLTAWQGDYLVNVLAQCQPEAEVEF